MDGKTEIAMQCEPVTSSFAPGGSDRMAWLAPCTLGFLVMAVIQTASPLITGNDGYYHVKMAELLPELGFVKTFPWLRWTILYDPFVSHHYGFHALLVPFVAVAKYLGFESAIGGKIAACVASAATFGVFHFLVRRRNVPFPLLWTAALLIVPWHYWLRMSYLRAPMAALPLLLLAVFWCSRGRTWALFFLAFVFTQVYGGAILFPIIPGCFLVAAIVEKSNVRISLWQVVASVMGIAAGLVISPYFPANVSFYYTQLFETGLGAERDVGGEWKSYDAWALLVQAAPLAGVWLTCLVLRMRVAVAATRTELAMLLINIAFLILTLKSRRFVEYWPVFAMLHAAEMAAVAWNSRAHAFPTRVSSAIRIVGYVLVATIGAQSLWVVRLESQVEPEVLAIRDAMSFLKANSPPQSRVFTDDWDTFPMCFYFNHHNTYIVGLDPEFTRTKYKALWERYRKITRGELPARLSSDVPAGPEPREINYEDIGTIFEADFVLVDTQHNKLYRALRDRPNHFEMIYPAKSDKQPPLSIFKILKNSA